MYQYLKKLDTSIKNTNTQTRMTLKKTLEENQCSCLGVFSPLIAVTAGKLKLNPQFVQFGLVIALLSPRCLLLLPCSSPFLLPHTLLQQKQAHRLLVFELKCLLSASFPPRVQPLSVPKQKWVLHWCRGGNLRYCWSSAWGVCAHSSGLAGVKDRRARLSAPRSAGMREEDLGRRRRCWSRRRPRVQQGFSRWD